jgi:hypothetical protein
MLVDDPKFIKLGPELRSGLIMTLCLAAANAGRLPSIEDMAIKFRLSEAKAQKLIDDLRDAGFIDEDESGLSTPQLGVTPGAAERMKRHRQRNRDVTGGVTMTG